MALARIHIHSIVVYTQEDSPPLSCSLQPPLRARACSLCLSLSLSLLLSLFSLSPPQPPALFSLYVSPSLLLPAFSPSRCISSSLPPDLCLSVFLSSILSLWARSYTYSLSRARPCCFNPPLPPLLTHSIVLTLSPHTPSPPLSRWFSRACALKHRACSLYTHLMLYGRRRLTHTHEYVDVCTSCMHMYNVIYTHIYIYLYIRECNHEKTP